jgi:release factor glutamine methyltransferase
MPTIGVAIHAAERELKASDAVDHPHRGKERVDAEDLMIFALGTTEFDDDDDLPPAAERRFRRGVERRLTGEPVAYVTGTTEFHGIQLEVRRGAFIPRQSSEWMADQAIRRLRGRRGPVYVDLATGIGPVALAVASAVPSAQVFGCDISSTPVWLARRNADRLGLANARFFRGDLFDALPSGLRGTVDVVTVHPPYVGHRHMKELPNEIRGFEPREALTDGSPLGTRILRTVADQAPTWLRNGGWLLVEVSPDRAREVASTLRHAGFRDVRSTKGGIVEVTRVVVGRT